MIDTNIKRQNFRALVINVIHSVKCGHRLGCDGKEGWSHTQCLSYAAKEARVDQHLIL